MPTGQGQVVPPEDATDEPTGYVAFAQNYPFANNIMIATAKTAAADLLAQTVIAGTPLDAVDWQRSLLFCLFGATYLGGFQYWYQVNIFKRIFTATERFTSQSMEKKLKDTEGLVQLAMQIALNLTILSCVYLPTFYLFKAVFFGDCGLASCFGDSWGTYRENFDNDLPALLKCWGPADLVCFSVPLYLRIPIRHVVSFCWTIYFSIVQSKK